MKLAIVSRPEIGSPRVLATTLNYFIHSLGGDSHVFFKAKAIKRLLKRKQVQYNPIIWFLYKAMHFVGDIIFFSRVSIYDAIVICDWTPNGFYKDSYGLERFRKRIGKKPILYYAVQYLENSPSQVEKLKSGGHYLTERYDWHLAVSDVTEIKSIPAPPWSVIGIYLKSTGLKPVKKENLIALIDFERKGYEHYRKEQIRVLEELNIPYISLEKKYSIEKIRKIYKKTTLYFIQFPEAFGLPIAECLASGNYVFTPHSGWPMAWRLDEDPEIHGPGKLPDCFVVYNNEIDLKNNILRIKNDFDPEKTPEKVFSIFIKYYPHYYEGNPNSLKNVLNLIENKELV